MRGKLQLLLCTHMASSVLRRLFCSKKTALGGFNNGWQGIKLCSRMNITYLASKAVSNWQVFGERTTANLSILCNFGYYCKPSYRPGANSSTSTVRPFSTWQPLWRTTRVSSIPSFIVHRSPAGKKDNYPPRQEQLRSLNPYVPCRQINTTKPNTHSLSLSRTFIQLIQPFSAKLLPSQTTSW